MIGILFLIFVLIHQFYSFNFTSFILFLVSFSFLRIGLQFFKKDFFFEKFQVSFNHFFIIFVSFYLVHFCTLIQNHFESFFFTDFDYIGIEEVINQILKGNFFRTNHYGKLAEANYLTHHFAFILILFTPFQFLSNLKLGYAYTNLFLFFTNLVILFLILRKFKISDQNKIYSYLILTLNPFFYRLNFSYHFEIIYLSFSLAFVYFYLNKHNILSWIFLILILFIKEDIAIYQFLIGIFLFSIHFDKKFIYYSVFCLLYFLFLKYYLSSNLGDSAKVDWTESWSYLGKNIFELKFNLMLEKIFLKKGIFLSIILIFLLPMIQLKRIFIFIIPILFIHFSSERIWYNSFYNYYSYTILPMLTIGFLFSFESNEKNEKLNKILLLSLFFTLYYFYLDKSIPLKNLNPNKNRIEILNEGIKLIPENSKIRTSFDIGGFFPRNMELYPLKQFQLNEDFIVLDKNSFSPFVALNEIEEEMKHKTNYKLIFEKEGLLIWRRIKISK